MKENRHVFVDFYGPFSYGRRRPLLDGRLFTAKMPPDPRLHLRHQKSAPECCSALGNKSVLKKLLLDSGGLLSALYPIGCHDDNDDEEHPDDCSRPPFDWFNSPNSKMTSQNHSLYFSLLIGCLSTLTSGTKLELYKKHCSHVTEPDKASPPPSKKPRLTDTCLYGGSDFDVLLQLDDGTRVSANREAVMGAEGKGKMGSEYFRALLGGGFGEAQINAEDPICIRDVSVGMLLPVLHYLHGCRLTVETAEEDDKQRRGRCQILEKLVLEGLGIDQKETNDQSSEHFAFHKTSLGEMMIGACRFLVAELQSELEDLCVSLLLPCSTRAEGNTKKTALRPDQECSESAEEKLASQTSEMELTENSAGQMKKPDSSLHQTESCKASLSGVTVKSSTPVYKSSLCSSIHDKSLDQEELASGPKDTSTSKILSALLPHLYWFSQRYSYPAVGRACLSLLLGCMDCPPAFSSSSRAADCLRRLAREADCVETLKQDLLSLATVALS